MYVWMYVELLKALKFVLLSDIYMYVRKYEKKTVYSCMYSMYVSIT